MNWRRDKAMVLLAVERHQAGGGTGRVRGRCAVKGACCACCACWSGSGPAADARQMLSGLHRPPVDDHSEVPHAHAVMRLHVSGL